MINLANKRCLANNQGIICMMSSNSKYDGYCSHCFIHLFPGDERSLNVGKKTKEMKVVNYVLNIFPNFKHDRPLYYDLEGGCCISKRKIDLRELIDGTIVAVEIDEEQKTYHLIPARYDDLFMDFSGKWIFIRYNPDPYRDKNGNKMNPSFEDRMTLLQAEIQKQIERIHNGENKELLEIVYLCYHEDKDD